MHPRDAHVIARRQNNALSCSIAITSYSPSPLLLLRKLVIRLDIFHYPELLFVTALYNSIPDRPTAPSCHHAAPCCKAQSPRKGCGPSQRNGKT